PTIGQIPIPPPPSSPSPPSPKYQILKHSSCPPCPQCWHMVHFPFTTSVQIIHPSCIFLHFSQYQLLTFSSIGFPQAPQLLYTKFMFVASSTGVRVGQYLVMKAATV